MAGILLALLDQLRLALKPATFPEARPAERGVPYRDRRVARWGAAPLADVYLPAGRGPHPSVVLVHGGGFLIGSRDMRPMRFLASHLARAGRAVASIDYRLLFRRGGLDGAIDDVAAALAWWQARAGGPGAWTGAGAAAGGGLPLDPERVSVCGLSAGATLALLALSRDDAPPLRSVASLFGIYDFSLLEGPLGRALARLALGPGTPAERRARSPVERYRSPAPLTLIHGDADSLVNVEQARLFEARRRAQGLPCRLAVFEGAPHGFLHDVAAPVAARAVEIVIESLDPLPVLRPPPAVLPPPLAVPRQP